MADSKRHIYLDADVPAHVVDAVSARLVVDIGVFQAAQMVLIGAVGQVVGIDADGADRAPMRADVGSCREIEQGIGWCGCLGVVGGMEMILSSGRRERRPKLKKK